MLDAHFETEERWRILAGTIAATVRNVQRTKVHDKVWSWEDFFPRAKKRSATSQTAEELDATLRGFDSLGRVKQRQKRLEKK